MFGANQATDAALLKAVNQRLSRSGGGSKTRISASVQQGTVTLSGNLQYDAQRSPLVKQVSRISGVRRVVDNLKLIPKTAYPAYQPPAPEAADVSAHAPPAPEATSPTE